MKANLRIVAFSTKTFFSGNTYKFERIRLESAFKNSLQNTNKKSVYDQLYQMNPFKEPEYDEW